MVWGHSDPKKSLQILVPPEKSATLFSETWVGGSEAVLASNLIITFLVINFCDKLEKFRDKLSDHHICHQIW